MTSTDSIAGVLIADADRALGIDYLDRHDDMIRSVTPDDVQRAIRRWFNPDRLTLVMVGKPEGMHADRRRKPLVRE